MMADDTPEQKDGALTKEDAIAVLSEVKDPEIMIDVWTLGLIYEIDIRPENKIFIKMTFTTPFCPYGPMLLDDIKRGLAERGFKEPKVEVVFDPPWEPSDELRAYLGLPV